MLHSVHIFFPEWYALSIPSRYVDAACLTVWPSTSLCCDDAANLRTAVTTMDALRLRWGLTYSKDKTKMPVAGSSSCRVSYRAAWGCMGSSVTIQVTWSAFSELTAL